MSHKHCKHQHDTCGSYGFLNPYVLIILILIVLQWFKMGASEPSLVNNGGLFIITLFLLVYCSCGNEAGRKKCRC
jgi:hypothetical protein